MIGAVCNTPPGQPIEPCRDVVGPSFLRPAVAVVAAVVVVALVVYLTRRDRGPLSTRRLWLTASLALVATAAITAAFWAGTHEFAVFMASSEARCTAVGGASGEGFPTNPIIDHCLRVARGAWIGSILGALASVVLLAYLANGRRAGRVSPEGRPVVT